MTGLEVSISKSISPLTVDVGGVASRIVQTQRGDGEIPWSDGDKTDPWDMVEAAMGLNIGGYHRQAEAAFRWLAGRQLDDGSWYASYRNGEPEDRTRDANMTSYIAVGLLHHYLITSDKKFLAEMWPAMKAAVDFAVSLQAPGGEIFWAVSPEGILDKMALLTGSSSVYMSLKCAIAAAGVLGHDTPEWRKAKELLFDALCHRPHSFNVSKSRYSMDWFYPILSGALTGGDARRRIEKYWDKYVVRGQGVLCVADQPWVTMAETSELVLALSAMGNQTLAQIVFGWIQDKCFDDGSYWCGYTYPDMVLWPEEKITWTNGVILMAADALYNLTPAGQMFSHHRWSNGHFAPLGE